MKTVFRILLVIDRVSKCPEWRNMKFISLNLQCYIKGLASWSSTNFTNFIFVWKFLLRSCIITEPFSTCLYQDKYKASRLNAGFKSAWDWSQQRIRIIRWYLVFFLAKFRTIISILWSALFFLFAVYWYISYGFGNFGGKILVVGILYHCLYFSLLKQWRGQKEETF